MTPDPILVVIFLRGGIDGLNLIGPTGDPDYIAARPDTLRVVREGDDAGRQLRQPIADVDFRFHPQAGPLGDLYDRGELAVIHAAGLVDGTRSHFDAETKMEHALANGSGTGWLGRYLNTTMPEGVLTALSVGTTVPASLAGYPDVAATEELEDLIVAGGHDLRPLFLNQFAGAGHPLLAATKSRLAKIDAALWKHLIDPATGEAQPYQTSVDYPNSPLAHALRPIAQAIKLDLGLRVATADFGGWDTHVGQARDFAGLVDGLGTSLTAFWDDLGQHKDHVQVVLMSEFGRRLRSNSGGGTDHGFGNAMLVLGQGISGGAMYGRWPGLRNEALDAGADLAITTDYRAVLSEIMSAHMAFADNAALFPDFTPQPVGLSRV